MKKHKIRAESHKQNGNSSRATHQATLDVKSPNATTRKAITNLETGKGKRFTSVGALMADLSDV